MPARDPGSYQSPTGDSGEFFGGGKGRILSPKSSGREAYMYTGYGGKDHYAFADLGPEKFTSIQIALMNSGYGSKLRLGVWDEKSASAMKKLMGDANTAGVDWRTQLATAEAGAKATEEAGELGKEPKQGKVINKPNVVTGGGTFKVTAKEDLQAAMRNTFNDLLAMDPSAAEEMVFIADQRSKEIWQQAVAQGQEDKMKNTAFMQDMADVNAVQAGQGALEGGQDIVTGGQQANVPNQVVEDAPNPQAVAEMIARTKYPEKYGAVSTNKRLGDILGSLGSMGPPNRPLAR